MDNYIYNIKDLDFNKTYSYADYVLWKFKERVELIKGKIFEMSPAPNLYHQEISANLYRMLDHCFSTHTCKLYYAPIDVALLNKKKSTSEQEIFTIVQPDLCIICDKEKLADGKKCVGAPDLVIEILSPGNSQKEMNLKFNLYEEAGVLEYWLVYPDMKSINIFVLENGKFIGLKPYSEEEILKSPLFPDLEVDVNKVFNKMKNLISWQDFEKLDIRTGTIISAVDFPKARKPAFQLEIDFGVLGTKKSSAQITDLYKKENLIGMQIIAIVNFPKKQIANFISECLVLGVYDENNAVTLINPNKKIENGSVVG